jgi:hypothetical protein
MMNKLGRKKWNVRICEKVSRVEKVVEYLARYIRGGPISNRRIIQVGDNAVIFNYGRKKPKFMTLGISEFIERFLQHIPPPNARWVRAYGLYSPSKTEALDKCRALLGQDPAEKPEKIQWQDGIKDSEDHPELCPICGKRLIRGSDIKPTGMIPYPGAPPLLALYLRQAA